MFLVLFLSVVMTRKLGNSRKNPDQTGEGGGGTGWGEDMEFPGVLKKDHAEIPREGSSKKSGNFQW